MKKIEIKTDQATLEKVLVSHKETMDQIVRLLEANNIGPNPQTILALFNIAATTIRDFGMISEEQMCEAIHTLYCEDPANCEACKELNEIGSMISLNASEMDPKDMN